jgi:hypothetical protein
MLENKPENQDTKNIRPTKKQKVLLEFIDSFIKVHGYSPSYREVMRGCNYTSVATVALHINSLINRGHLTKRDNSARSLEVTKPTGDNKKTTSNQVTDSQEKWLVEKVEHFFIQAESASKLEAEKIDQLYVLIGSLKVLGLEGAAHSFIPRLSKIKEKA